MESPLDASSIKVELIEDDDDTYIVPDLIDMESIKVIKLESNIKLEESEIDLGPVKIEERQQQGSDDPHNVINSELTKSNNKRIINLNKIISVKVKPIPMKTNTQQMRELRQRLNNIHKPGKSKKATKRNATNKQPNGVRQTPSTITFTQRMRDFRQRLMNIDQSVKTSVYVEGKPAKAATPISRESEENKPIEKSNSIKSTSQVKRELHQRLMQLDYIYTPRAYKTNRLPAKSSAQSMRELRQYRKNLIDAKEDNTTNCKPTTKCKENEVK